MIGKIIVIRQTTTERLEWREWINNIVINPELLEEKENHAEENHAEENHAEENHAEKKRKPEEKKISFEIIIN